MLKAEIEARRKCKVRKAATEPPDNVSVLPRYPVKCACMACGYEIISVRILVDAVDMKIVPWTSRRESIARHLTPERFDKRFIESDMVYGRPLENGLVSPEFEVLEIAVHQPPLPGDIIGRQIMMFRVVERE